MHAVAETHDTLSKRSPPGPGPGLGLGTTDQRAPFHDSTRVLVLWPPTAVHAVAETHDTPQRVLPRTSGPG